MSDQTAPAPLTPPAASAMLTLTPPAPVEAVATTAAGAMAPLDQAALPALDAKVTSYVDTLLALDVHSPEFTAKTNDVQNMGADEINAAAETSNRLLQSPVRAMKQGGLSEGSKVASTLTDLRRTVEGLDPKQATGVKKLLGFIPFGDKMQDYFHQYESAQEHIDAIIKALYNGQDELRKDNAALEQEKVHLWETIERLNQYIYVAESLDRTLEAKIAEIEVADPERGKTLKQDVLFYVRQRHQDLLTQLAVSIQGYLAIDLIRKNNIELIKGVDRATTTTIAALRTAVIVAQALSNQKLVLDQITALNTTTSNMIESTSQLLATQSVAIHQESASATISVEKLQAAFANIYQTMDAIDTFKVQALDSMGKTIGSLQTEITKAQTYVERVQKSNDNTTSGALDLGPGI